MYCFTLKLSALCTWRFSIRSDGFLFYHYHHIAFIVIEFSFRFSFSWCRIFGIKQHEREHNARRKKIEWNNNIELTQHFQQNGIPCEFAIRVTIDDLRVKREKIETYFFFRSLACLHFDFEIHLEIQHANTKLRTLSLSSLFKCFRNCGNADGFTVGLNVHLPKISFYEFKSYFWFWTIRTQFDVRHTAYNVWAW